MKDSIQNLLQTKTFNQCTLCAYQESGHILFAYLCGYHCLETELVQHPGADDVRSFSVIDYDSDAWLADKFLGDESDVKFFSGLSTAGKMQALETGRKLALVFLGGSVTAAVFTNDGNPQIPLPMQIEYNDLQRVEFIDKVLQLLADTEENFIENRLQDALYTISNINLWNTVTDLATRLLHSHQLNRNDIEECLEEHGVIYHEASPL